MVTKEQLQSALHLSDAGTMIYDLIAELDQRIKKLEQEVAHLKGESTDDDVDRIIESGLNKEAFKNESR